MRTAAEAITVECGGPRVYTYEELLRTIARAASINRTLVLVPFTAWHALTWVAELLPGAPVTRNQVELMVDRSSERQAVSRSRDLPKESLTRAVTSFATVGMGG